MDNIVLFGRTGNGKSSTGNSIVGKHVFATKSDEACVTMESESEIVETPDGGPKLRVIDTPGLFDLTSSADYISKEIVRCLHLAEGGLDAVLLVLSVRNRHTKEDEVVLSTLKVIFGSKIVDYLIVVFTAGDVLEEDNETIESYLDRCPHFLKRLLESCEQRMVVFDNKTENEGKKTKQFQELLNTIDLVKKHTNYKPYTEDMDHKITIEKDDRMAQEREQRVGEQGFRPNATQNVMGCEPGFALMEMTPPDFVPIGRGPDISAGKEASFAPMGMLTPSFAPDLTESVLLQMRSKTEAQKAREDRQNAEEERHLEEVQNEIDRMQ